MTATSSPTHALPVDRSVRLFIAAALLLVGSAATSLLLFADQPSQYFAWTIKPPLTAGFLGGGYAAVTVALLLACGRPDWREVRLGVAVVSTGLVTILAATLLHLDRFHLHAESTSARLWAWAWLVWYVVLPPALGWTLLRQRRQLQRAASGRDANRVPTRLPGSYRTAVQALAALVGALGLVLFVAPAASTAIWPWPLTPLTARMVGAYLLAIAVSLTTAARCETFMQTRVATPAWITFAVLQLGQLALYRDTMTGRPWMVVLLVGWLAALLALGAAGLWAARVEHSAVPSPTPRRLP